MKIEVVIPAKNEEQSISQVLLSIPKDSVNRIIVVDNNSQDSTAEIASQLGATVVSEPREGYGSACLRGIEEAAAADVIVFLDADFSDDPSELPQLIEPIVKNDADLVIGSRTLGKREHGALPYHALFGNLLACFFIRILFGYRFTDLGPFRAIRQKTLQKLNMQDTNYGWTVEMQVKAANMQVKYCEVPMSYRKRIGKSKISGTIQGSIKAGCKILWTIFYWWFKRK